MDYYSSVNGNFFFNFFNVEHDIFRYKNEVKYVLICYDFDKIKNFDYLKLLETDV